MTNITMLQHKNPSPGVMKVTILVDHYYIHSLSELCSAAEKKILEEMIQFHYMTYMVAPQHKNPCPGDHEIYNLIDHSLLVITLYLVCLKYTRELRRRYLFEKKMQINSLIYMATPYHKKHCLGGMKFYTFIDF